MCVRPANLRKGCFDSTVTGAIHDGDLETVRKWLEKGDADAIPMVDKRFSKKDRRAADGQLYWNIRDFTVRRPGENIMFLG